MKKIYTLSAVLAAFALQAQFTVTIQTPADFKDWMLFYIHLTDQKILLLLKKRVRIVHGLLNIRGIIWG